ncbi:MAG: hypothetical protein ACYSU8_08645 [Planctomycetota bacterium]
MRWQRPQLFSAIAQTAGKTFLKLRKAVAERTSQDLRSEPAAAAAGG